MFALLVSVRPQSCQALRWVWNQDVKPWCRRPSTGPLLCPTERFSSGQATATYLLTTSCYHISPVLARQIQLQATTDTGKHKYKESTPWIRRKQEKNINTPTNASVILNRADIVDKKTAKIRFNEKGTDLTEKNKMVYICKYVICMYVIWCICKVCKYVKCRFRKNLKTKKFVILLL